MVIGEKKDPLIPTGLFEERKEFSLQIPFYKRNKNQTSHTISLPTIKLNLGIFGKLERLDLSLC